MKIFLGKKARLISGAWFMWIVLLLLIPVSLPGKTTVTIDSRETGNPFIHNYRPADYGAHFQNWWVTQDHRGVMFFANGSGVLEFDGSSWRLIKLPRGAGVFSLAAGPDGKIYVGALGQFGYLEANTEGKLEFVSLYEKLDKKDRDFADICSISVTADLVCFKSLYKIFLYGDIHGKPKIFPLSTSPYSSVIKGEIFVTDAKGIHVVRDNGPQWLPGTEEISYPDSGLVFLLPYEDPEKPDQVLIATGQKGFYLYGITPLPDPRTGKFSGDLSGIASPAQAPRPFHTELDGYLRQHQLYNWAGVGKGYVFGTLRGGIVRMGAAGKKLGVIGKKQGLRKDNVLFVFLDRDKNLWAGLNNGIAYIELSSPITRFAEHMGLEETVLATERYRGRLYVGAYDGLFRTGEHKKGERETQGPLQRVGNIRTSCWDLLSGRQGLWVANNNGITRIDETPGHRYFHKDLVYCMGRTPRFPRYIFLGLREGLALLNTAGAEGNFRCFYDGSLKEIKRVIRRIESDKEGNLWLTTHNRGFIRLTFTGNEPWNFDTRRFSEIEGMPLEGAKVYCYGGSVFATGRDKIFRYRFPEGTFVPEHRLNAALEGKTSQLYHLLAEGNGPILVNSNGGTGALVPGPGDGFQWRRAPFKKVKGAVQDLLREPGGITWFSTSEGLYRYDPAGEKDYRRPYAVLIRNVRLPDGRVLFHGYEKGGDRSGQEERVLRYLDNSLSFEFSAAFYEHTEANRFSWMLEGYDSGWNRWTGDTKAVYTNLWEGNYRFKVKARNVFDRESSVAVFPFRIAPPWYRDNIAYGGYLLLFMAISAAIYLVHRRKVEHAVREVHRKYDKCYLEPKKAEEYKKTLLRFVETKKPYLDPNLSLNSLAKAVGLQRHYISQVLNVNLKKTFWEFINEFRIKEAVKILTDPSQKDLSILDIAFQAGFNSSASFNRAFKRHTGKTPLKYKREAATSRTL